MPTDSRFDAAHPGGIVRWTIGVLVSSRCRRVDAVLVSAVGRGLQARIRIKGFNTAEVPYEAVRLFEQLTGAGSVAAGSISPEMVATLRANLAETQASLVASLPAAAEVASARVLAVGVHDPGLWSTGKARPRSYLGFCDAARLAEMTGLNVIDAFPARDLAQGGQGGPINALAVWLLLRDPDEDRVLLELGRTVRMSYLPADREPTACWRVLSFDVGPGTRLLDLLTRRLTGGEHTFDPGGRFAVQGRRIGELVEHWLADPSFKRPLPRWNPGGVRPERFLTDAVSMAVRHDWSVRDLLCSATHFVAESIARALRQRLPEDAEIRQILITGGGQQNGMLLREIAARVPHIPFVQVPELGISSGAIGPASVAVLALCHLDQVPGNLTAVTGAEIPRVLGRLTPGSPQSWQRLLRELGGNPTPLRPLRIAI